MKEIEHFITGQRDPHGIPLERYLQLLPGNVVSAYVANYTEPGAVAWDPFAQTGALLLESVPQGRRAIASNFNPINALVVRALLTLASPQELDAATTLVGDSLKRGVPLREHINRLYATTCNSCLLPVTAEYFVWAEGRPLQKQYHCPHCAAEGLVPVEQADLEVLDHIERQGVHYWYLMDRLAQPHEPERRLAQELLELYTPRNLYALADLSMKIEMLFSDSPTLVGLQLLLLGCLDTCSKLDAASLARPTARRLHPPSRFVERNVWRAFEEAYRQVRQLSSASLIALDRDLQGDFQALVLDEPLRAVASMLPPASVSLIVSAPPAYSRPFWALSYLWSGWLWGREKAALFKPLLRRKMMGWSWYQRSLARALNTLLRPLRPQGKIILILRTADLAQVTNLILAALSAGLKLDRSLYQSRHPVASGQPQQGPEGEYRLCFSKNAGIDHEPQEPSLDTFATALRERGLAAVEELLRERGEALSFSWLHNTVYEAWAQNDSLRQALSLRKKLLVADFLEEQIGAALEEGRLKGSLQLLSRDAEGQEPALWWLGGKGYPRRPLGDRVEHAVHQALSAISQAACEPFKDGIYSLFPGFFTPGPGLVEECLDSYAACDEASGRVHLRPKDHKDSWARERDQVLSMLATLGTRLGYAVLLAPQQRPHEQHNPHPRPRGQEKPWQPRLPTGIDVAWGEEEQLRHLFAFRQSTALGDVLSDRNRGAFGGRRYLVTPERRVPLLRFRMQAEFLLARALAEGGWQVLKLSHLTDLAAKEHPDRQDLAQIIGLEPLIETPDAQLRLFS